MPKKAILAAAVLINLNAAAVIVRMMGPVSAGMAVLVAVRYLAFSAQCIYS